MFDFLRALFIISINVFDLNLSCFSKGRENLMTLISITVKTKEIKSL